jgi:hypothetical protein
MRKAILAVFLFALASVAGAQEATLNTPAARASEAKYKVKTLQLSETTAEFVISVQDASNNEIRTIGIVIPNAAQPAASVSGVFTAIDTARASETGSVLRRANFRLLGYLADQSLLTGVTLVP